MHDLSDEKQRRLFDEVLLGELRAIRECISNVPTRQEFRALRDDVAGLKADMKVVKAALSDQSRQLANHEERLTRLENAP